MTDTPIKGDRSRAGRSPTIASQIAWARGQAAQHARLATRAAPGSPSRAVALRRRRVAEAAIRTLESIQPRKR